MKQSHRYNELQLARLRSFCFAATEGNFTAAAAALGLSASTVWQQVSDVHIRPFDPKMERLQIELAVRKGTHLPDDVQEFRRIVRQHLSESDRNGKEK